MEEVEEHPDAVIGKFFIKSFTTIVLFETGALITHKYRGSQQFSISKSVEPNEELKVE